MNDLQMIRQIAQSHPEGGEPAPINLPTETIEETLRYLASPEALSAISEDPYWPKWEGPWWRMTLLFEMGLASSIPQPCVEAMVRALDTHFLRFFPTRPEELPPGTDAVRHVACHCCLGTAVQVLTACGVDVDDAASWIRPWFLRYQLPDGGLNCDELAYSRTTPHSSVVSTLPALEAILFCTRRPFTSEERSFLKKGADYLLQRSLFRSLSRNGSIINEAWLKLCFPRFYEYDILRGLRFVVRWAETLQEPLPAESVVDAVNVIHASESIAPGRQIFIEERRTRRQQSDRSWTLCHDARSFRLLDEVSKPGVASRHLETEWNQILASLARLDRLGLLVYRPHACAPRK